MEDSSSRTLSKKHSNVEADEAKVDANIKPDWHHQHEVVLKTWSEKARSNQWLHGRSYKRMSRINVAMSLPVIILSTIAGTMNFAQNSFPEKLTVNDTEYPVREWVGLLTGAINLTASLITTCATFMRISERMENHRSCGIDFGKLSRDIQCELSLPQQDRRHKVGVQYISKCREELERLENLAPDVSLGVLKEFKKRFKKSSFSKPDQFTIVPTTIYRPPVDEQELKIKALAEHEAVRKQAAADFKKYVDQTARKLEKSRHKRRKSAVRATSVTQSMSRLISSIGARTQAADAVLEGLRAEKELEMPAASDTVVIEVADTGVAADEDDSTPTVCSLSGDDVAIDDSAEEADNSDDASET